MKREQNAQLIGNSAPMLELRDEIARVSLSDAKVLITGESGVGKELVARAIHAGGPRAHGAFVAMNCAGLPETLLRRPCSSPSCSVTSRAALPAPTVTRPASSNSRIAAPCSSTRSAK
jgi:hypothetical protein